MNKAVFATLLFCVSGLDLSCAHDLNKAPDQKKHTPAVFRFYQSVVSPTDGDRCRMYPSCSAYTAEAVMDYGWFAGWILGCDRLLRCGGDEEKVSEIKVDGADRLIKDPLSANVLWWHESAGGEKP